MPSANSLSQICGKKSRFTRKFIMFSVMQDNVWMSIHATYIRMTHILRDPTSLRQQFIGHVVAIKVRELGSWKFATPVWILRLRTWPFLLPIRIRRIPTMRRSAFHTIPLISIDPIPNRGSSAPSPNIIERHRHFRQHCPARKARRIARPPLLESFAWLQMEMPMRGLR
jgi:hypothetical protein